MAAPDHGQILGKATSKCQAIHGSHGRERDPYILTGDSRALIGYELSPRHKDDAHTHKAK